MRGESVFSEVRSVLRSEVTDGRERYLSLDGLLVRLLKELTADASVEFTNVVSRIRFLSRRAGVSSLGLEEFHAGANRLRFGLEGVDAGGGSFDLRALCEGLSAFTGEKVPEDLCVCFPLYGECVGGGGPCVGRCVERMRLTVSHFEGCFVFGTDNMHPGGGLLRVRYCSDGDDVFGALAGQAVEGSELNLLNVRCVEDVVGPVLVPEFVVLEPDYLVDITALCGCVTQCGVTPFAYLAGLFRAAPRSVAIQRGNVANGFLDDCVNNDRGVADEELFFRSMKQSFAAAPLVYCSLKGVDRSFFEACRLQFANISDAVVNKFRSAEVDIDCSDVVLEPSFLCEALGLQGRMDLLSLDGCRLVELKSGRMREFPRCVPRREHRLQMALYREVLCFNLGLDREEVRSFLFYSLYPAVFAVDESREVVRRAIALRNAVVWHMLRLVGGFSREEIGLVDEENLNVAGRDDAFYRKFLRPQIESVTGPLHGMGGVEEAYFHRMVSFVAREQYLARVGDGRPEASGGFADAWRLDTRTKQENGSILVDLRLSPILSGDGSVVGFDVVVPVQGDDVLPNFRCGDMVLLYRRDKEGDGVCGRQIFRCTIDELGVGSLRLSLAFRQRNAGVFRFDVLYAIEPAYSDGVFHQAYRGLFSLLVCPSERKRLLLGLRRPEVCGDVCLNLPIEDAHLADIVFRAKQARDFYLLVGPPGTGKTSVVLRLMVAEMLSERPCPSLLIASYTNRAVDEICGMLSTLDIAGGYVRIGYEHGCGVGYRSRLLKNVMCDVSGRDEFISRLAGVSVVVGTVCSLASNLELFELKSFDVAFVDEASQVLEPWILPLWCAKRNGVSAVGKFVLVGDHKQLPAVVVQGGRFSRVDDECLRGIGLEDCRDSLFERLWRWVGGDERFVGVLHRQGRMHEDICRYVSELFYDGGLGCIPLPHQRGGLGCVVPAGADALTCFVGGTRVGFVDVRGVGGVGRCSIKSNAREADVVARLVRALCVLYCLDGDAVGRRIGVIVPFRAQISMVRRALFACGVAGVEGMTIDTVERYQGSQRDFVIFSATVSRMHQLSTLSELSVVDGKVVDRKLNVVLSRARCQLFLVGDVSLLRGAEAYDRLIGLLDGEQVFRVE